MTKRMLATGFIFMGFFSTTVQSEEMAKQFSFDALTLQEPIKLADYQGKVILVVNTASKCGFTGQYKELEALYQKYKDKGLIVIGVPSNDFGAQEPGEEEEIAEFCEINYGITFPMTAKYSVKGDNAHPFYLWAKKELGFGTAPKWNFHKYVINRQGELVKFFNSTTSPESSRVVKVIEDLLEEN